MMVVNAWSWDFVELLSRPVCQLTKSFHTFLGMTFHIVGPRRNTKILGVLKFFSCSCVNSGFKHGSVTVSNIFAYFTLSLSTPGPHDQQKMLVLPNRLLYWVHSTSDQSSVSFRPFLCHPHTQIRITPFSRCTKKHSQLETSSQPYFNRIFSNCLSDNNPAKGWPYRFRSRGTTGSSILDHDLGLVDESKCLDIQGLEFSIICKHLPFWPGYKQILRPQPIFHLHHHFLLKVFIFLFPVTTFTSTFSHLIL